MSRGPGRHRGHHEERLHYTYMREQRPVSLMWLAAALCLPVAALAAFGFPPSFAQAPDPGARQESKDVPLSKVERKNKAPVSKEVLRVKLPKPREFSLDNGLTVLVLEDHRTPTVSVELHLRGAGALHEPADAPGLAGITAQMLREGTKTRTSKQIAEEVDRLGAALFISAPFGSDEATISASGLSDNLEKWFALTADVLLNPTFPDEELSRLKQRMKVQLRQQRTLPSFLLAERFNRAVYGAHPAAVVSATPESVDAVTTEALQKWRRERYVPQHAILGITGDVGLTDLMRLRSLLQGWSKTDSSPAGNPPGSKPESPAHPAPAASRKVHLVHRPNSVQTLVSIGNIAIDRRHSDYVAMVVMNRIVGGGPAARLFMNLREEKGYTYGVYSSFSAASYPGPWRAGGDMRTEVTAGAMTEFMREIARIRDEKVQAAELEEAKRSLVAGFALSLERPAQLLGYAITRKIYGFSEDYWDSYPGRVMAVTGDDVQRVARNYLNPEAIQIAAVGDATKIRTVLEKFGPVELYGADGRPQKPPDIPKTPDP